MFADPLFVDPEHGDYRLQAESPAWQLGFQAFDLDQFGLTAEFPNMWAEW
jgi:hypothetical protein